jgi:hypothetical protein
MLSAINQLRGTTYRNIRYNLGLFVNLVTEDMFIDSRSFLKPSPPHTLHYLHLTAINNIKELISRNTVKVNNYGSWILVRRSVNKPSVLKSLQE